MKELEFLARLRRKREQYALEALESPGEKSAYEYGYRVGVVDGFKRAIDELMQELADERDKDDRL